MERMRIEFRAFRSFHYLSQIHYPNPVAHVLDDGKVMGECMPRHRHQEFLRFMRRVERETPQELELHVILDNYGSHRWEARLAAPWPTTSPFPRSSSGGWSIDSRPTTTDTTDRGDAGKDGLGPWLRRLLGYRCLAVEVGGPEADVTPVKVYATNPPLYVVAHSLGSYCSNLSPRS